MILKQQYSNTHYLVNWECSEHKRQKCNYNYVTSILENAMNPRPNSGTKMSPEQKARLLAMINKDSNVLFVDFKKGK